MSETNIIEVHEAAAGLVERERSDVRLPLAATEFAGLNGRLFCNPEAAERAATRYGTKGDHHVER